LLWFVDKRPGVKDNTRQQPQAVAYAAIKITQQQRQRNYLKRKN